ncbi:hypothetical protein LG3211_2360 [Lysobacter gummosus]|nr:hypothetical protein LG3211_2360 [Lysobacter gummosus]
MRQRKGGLRAAFFMVDRLLSGPAVCFASAKPSIERLRRRLPVGVIFQIVIPAKASVRRLQRHLPRRHSREGECPETSAPSSTPSFPRRRAPLYFGGAEHPGTSASSSRSSFARKRESRGFSVIFPIVIPANAGIQ